jgi:hypothetical protein
MNLSHCVREMGAQILNNRDKNKGDVYILSNWVFSQFSIEKQKCAHELTRYKKVRLATPLLTKWTCKKGLKLVNVRVSVNSY